MKKISLLILFSLFVFSCTDSEKAFDPTVINTTKNNYYTNNVSNYYTNNIYITNNFFSNFYISNTFITNTIYTNGNMRIKTVLLVAPYSPLIKNVSGSIMWEITNFQLSNNILFHFVHWYYRNNWYVWQKEDVIKVSNGYGYCGAPFTNEIAYGSNLFFYFWETE